jgi:ABC-2 type transport system permease protein
MRKYLKLYSIFLRNSFVKEFSDPLNLFIAHLAVIAWMLSIFIFYKVIFEHLNDIAGWSWPECLILIGTFFTIDGLIYTLFYWNFLKIKNFVKNNNLDIILVKPISSQFLMSTQEIQASMYIQFIITIIFIVLGVTNLEITLGLIDIATYIFFLICATLIAYSIWFISICTVFWIPSVENIIYFFEEIFNFAVYPSQIYSGVLKIIFSLIIPLSLMVTIPSQIITKEVNSKSLQIVLITTIILFLLSKSLWKIGLRKYTTS